MCKNNVKKKILIKFITYIIHNKSYYSNEKWLNFIEFILHNNYANEEYLVNYSV